MRFAGADLLACAGNELETVLDSVCSFNVRERYGGHIDTPDLVDGKWRHAGQQWAAGLG